MQSRHRTKSVCHCQNLTKSLCTFHKCGGGVLSTSYIDARARAWYNIINYNFLWNFSRKDMDRYDDLQKMRNE